MTTRARVHAAARALVLAALLAGWPCAAKPAEPDPLAGRLGPVAAAAVRVLVEDARSQRLPTAPLIATALEGGARGATSDRIVDAVRTELAGLKAASAALGPRSAEQDVAAGASAIRAGIPADSLANLRVVRARSAVIPLVVMADMVARGVPPSAASGSVLHSLRAGVRDADLLRLRESVAQDIQDGTAPGVAAAVRTRILLGGSPDGSNGRPVPRPRRPGFPP